MEQITILMAAYNGERYLKKQLESILGQDRDGWKLVIWDDVSTDGTWEILKEYQQSNPDRIEIHRNEENRGVTKNFLTMLFQSVQGRNPDDQSYYMFADQDDIWHKDKVRRTMERMKKMEKKYGADVPAMVFADSAVVDEFGNPIHPSFQKMQHLKTKKHILPHLLMENVCQGCTILMNTALAAKLHTIPTHAKYHDGWMALLAAGMGHISFVEEALVDYRQHGANLVGSMTFTSYVAKSRHKMDENRASLRANFQQAREFLQIYQNDLPPDKLHVVKRFLQLPKQGFFKRRLVLLRYGYCKSGLLRNLGLLLLI